MFSPLFNFVVLGLAVCWSALSKPLASPGLVSSRQNEQHQGKATFFFQNGVAGACGQVHSDLDNIVALQTTLYANGAHCGQTISITDTDTGTTATAVVADECPSCENENDIDLSQGLFQIFANTDVGVIPVVWNFV